MIDFDVTFRICRAMKSQRHVLFNINNSAILRVKTIPGTSLYQGCFSRLRFVRKYRALSLVNRKKTLLIRGVVVERRTALYCIKGQSQH